MADLGLKGRPGRRTAGLALFALAACGGEHDRETLAERLRGSWVCQREFPDRGFVRKDDVELAVTASSLELNYNVFWSCDTLAPCPGPPPAPSSGYYEGVYRDLGDSLALLDALDSVAFRDVADTGFTLLINGSLAFPMRRR